MAEQQSTAAASEAEEETVDIKVPRSFFETPKKVTPIRKKAPPSQHNPFVGSNRVCTMEAVSCGLAYLIEQEPNEGLSQSGDSEWGRQLFLGTLRAALEHSIRHHDEGGAA